MGKERICRGQNLFFFISVSDVWCWYSMIRQKWLDMLLCHCTVWRLEMPPWLPLTRIIKDADDSFFAAICRTTSERVVFASAKRLAVLSTDDRFMSVCRYCNCVYACHIWLIAYKWFSERLWEHWQHQKTKVQNVVNERRMYSNEDNDITWVE